MINSPIDGEQYWSIAISSEAANYEVYGPKGCFCWPWKGVLTAHPSIVGFYYKLHSDVNDSDPNSLAVVDSEDLYATETEALLAYAEAAEKKSRDMIDEAHEISAAAVRARAIAASIPREKGT